MIEIELTEWTGESMVAAATSAAPLGGLAWLDGDGVSELGATSYLAVGPVETVSGSLDELRLLADPRATCPRWIGYITYEGEFRFSRYDALIRQRGTRAFILAEHEDAAAKLKNAISGSATLPPARVGAPHSTPVDSHARAIERAREYIAAGDIYQVNLARQWWAEFEGPALHLFTSMRRVSPVPLGFYLDAGDQTVCARTMERFLRWEPDAEGCGPLESRPIKGTVERAGNDDAEAKSLRSDAKELAEHSMIVDLMRNDLGRVAKTGSVRVVDPFRVEPYAKLHHLVTTVRCETKDGTSLREVLHATFPPGSITGAPKIRAMEIIDELESGARGVYCGAVGYIGRSVELAVAIRTAVVADGQVTYHAGGGLVWASDAQREVAETELKALAFLDALGTLSA